MAAVPPNLNGTYYEITVPGNVVWLMTTMTNGAAPNLTSTYKVTIDIDMTGYTAVNTLESICNTAVATEGPFVGVFDGQGFTITISLPDVKTTDYFGLFGFVGDGSATGASISNLNVVYTGSTFSYTPSPAPAISYLGSLVGYCNTATINNCNITYSNDVVITSTNTTTTSQQYTGGICGRIENTSVLTNSTITFNGTSKILHGGTVAGSITAVRAVGGICGYMGNIANTVTNTLQFCNIYISKDTILGSEGTGTAQLASKIGGICGAAAGDVILDNCKVLETPTASGGTLLIQNSGSNTLVLAAECNPAVLIGELRQEALLSSNRQITVCEFSLANFDISFQINYSGFLNCNIGCFIGKAYDSTVQAAATRPITNINNISGLAKSISIYNRINAANSNPGYFMGGMFGKIGGANQMILNVNTCTLTTVNNYTVQFIVIIVSGTAVTPLNYGGITSYVIIGTIPASITDPTSENYRKYEDCNLNIGGNSTINISQTQPAVTFAPNESTIGGLFGKGLGVFGPTLTRPLIIRRCNATYGGNFSIVYINTVTSTSTALVSNGVFLGGFIGSTQGCTVSDCNYTFGSINNNNNTMSITANVTVAYNSYMSLGIGQISNLQSSSIVPTTISGCHIMVYGNVTLTNNNNNVIAGSAPVRQAWNGGLVGRINNASTCTASTLTITGTYDSSAKSSTDSATIGGLVGDVISTAALGYSTLSACQGTIGGACTFNSNVNIAFRGLIGGMAGLIAAFGKLDTNTITYNGSLTMISTNSLGAGTRFLGGLVGLSFDSSTLSKIITNSLITVNGAVVITLGSTVDNIAGGLFGRLADGTTCSGCSGTFNSTLSITSNGTSAGNKIIAALCANVLNNATTAAATITTSSITVASTTQLISNVNLAGNTTYTGILFGLVQDAATNGGTSATTCTGTFNGTVTLHSNNIGVGAVYMGGIVANNIRSQINSMILNLLNGVEMDNISITNLFCNAGLIAGTSGPAATSNIAEIINSTVNVTGTALIDTNSTTSSSIVGGLGGVIDSRFENNTVNGENCAFTINSSATIAGAWAGGLIGSITNTALQSYNVINNTLNAGSLNINVSSAQASHIAGMIGRIQNTGTTQKITVSNNSVLVGNSTSLTNVLTNPTVYVALLFAYVDTVTLPDPTVITNNIFLTANTITITASNASNVIYINDLVAFYNASIPTVSNNSAYICRINPTYLLQFQSYPSADADGLTIYSTNYPITSEYVVPAAYRIDILPAITIIITCMIPPPVIPSVPVCCTANICDKNPQVANYSNEVIINRKGGQALIANVNEIYAAQRTNTAGIRVTPIFSSYQQYMTYLQSKNSI